MDPISISLAVVATSNTICSVLRLLYRFIHSAKTVDTTLTALYDEVKSLSDVITAVDEALKNPVILKRRDGKLFDDRLGQSVNNAVKDCQHTVTTLEKLLKPLEIERAKSSSFKRAVKQVRLNLKVDDITNIRYRLGTHSTCLQISLQMTILITTLVNNTDTANGVNSKLDEFDTKLERLVSTLDALQLISNNQNLPATIRNPNITSHSEELKINAKAVVTSAGSIANTRDGNEAGGDNQSWSISGVLPDDTRTAGIRQRIEQMSLSGHSVKRNDNILDNRGDINIINDPGFDGHDDPQANNAVDYNIALGLFKKARCLESHGSASEAMRAYHEALKHGSNLGPGHKRLLRFDLKRLRAAYHMLRCESLQESERMFHSLLDQVDDKTYSDLCTSYAYHGLALLHVRYAFCNVAESWCRKAVDGWRGLNINQDEEPHSDSLQLLALIYEIDGNVFKAQVTAKLVSRSSRRVTRRLQYRELHDLAKVPTVHAIKSLHKRSIEQILSIAVPGGKRALPLLRGNSALFRVIQKIDVQDTLTMSGMRLAMDYCLEHGSSINGLDSLGWSPLLVATNLGRTSVVAYLLEKGAEVDQITKNGDKRTPLHIAVRRNDSEMVKLLLANGASINWQDSQGQTPLDYAISHTSAENKTVLGSLLNNRSSIDATSYWKSRLLYRAVREGRAALAEVLLDHGAPVDARDPKNCTPLHYAAKGGETAVAEILLDHGALVNARNDDNMTPLQITVMIESVAVAELLLSHGASINADDHYETTPLYHAAMRGNAAAMRIMLDQGAFVYGRRKCDYLHSCRFNEPANDQDGRTPLHNTVDRRYRHVARKTNDRGASVHAECTHGIKPLNVVKHGQGFDKPMLDPTEGHRRKGKGPVYEDSKD